MKKILLFYFAMASLLAYAQSSIGDTIDNTLRPTYMRNCMDWTYDDWRSPRIDTTRVWEACHLPLHWHGGFNWIQLGGVVDFGVEYTTDHPIRIIGAAAVATMQHWADTTTSFWNDALTYFDSSKSEFRFPNTLDTTVSGRLDEYLCIYKPSDQGDPVLLTQGSWRIEQQHSYIHLPGQHAGAKNTETLDYWIEPGQNPSAPFHADAVCYKPVYEVFFDKPVVVDGTFIVMGTANNNSVSRVVRYIWPDVPPTPYTWEWMDLWDHNPTRYWSVRGFTPIEEYPEPCVFNWHHVHDSLYNQYSWRRYVDSYDFGGFGDNKFVGSYLIWPILDPTYDTLICDEIASVGVAEATDTTITVMWSGGNNIEWEVMYVGGGAADTSYLTTTVPTVTIAGLSPNTYYRVWVRGRCDSTRPFGAWSEPEYIRTDQPHEPQRIAQVDRYTQMMPNPASGDVNVVSYYLQDRVVVYDLRGNMVLDHRSPGSTTTFNVGNLPKGVYVVAIHTPAGIATKRLVVE